jgi:hypothetical protein
LAAAQGHRLSRGIAQFGWRRRAQLVCQSAEMIHDSGRERFEPGQEISTNADPQETAIFIRRVICMLDPVARQVCHNVCLAGSNHGAEQHAAARGQDRQAARAGTSEQPHQNRLSPIIGVVGSGNEPRSQPRRSLAQRLVARGPSARL